MKCPDCKIEMEEVNRVIDASYKTGIAENVETRLYRCPKCFLEIEVDDEDYEEDE